MSDKDYITRMKEADEMKAKRRKEEKESDQADHEYYSSPNDEAAERLVNEMLSYDIIDDMYEKGYIPMIYNGCYGGFGWSGRAESLIELIKRELGIDDSGTTDSSPRIVFRIKRNPCPNEYDTFIEDKVIRYLEKIGKKAGDRFGRPEFEFDRKELRNYIRIHEYDGLERLEFDYTHYFHDKVKEIMSIITNINDEQKVRAIDELIGKEITDPIICADDDEMMATIAASSSSSDYSGRTPVLQIPRKLKDDGKKKQRDDEAQDELIV